MTKFYVKRTGVKGRTLHIGKRPGAETPTSFGDAPPPEEALLDTPEEAYATFGEWEARWGTSLYPHAARVELVAVTELRPLMEVVEDAKDLLERRSGSLLDANVTEIERIAAELTDHINAADEG